METLNKVRIGNPEQNKFRDIELGGKYMIRQKVFNRTQLIRFKVIEIQPTKNPNNSILLCKTMQNKIIKIKAIRLLDAYGLSYM